MQNSSGRASHNSAVTLDRVDVFDFCSRFPLVVATACEMLGLDESDERVSPSPGDFHTREPRLGLHVAFGGDDRHAAAPAARAVALVTGNGYYLIAHAASLWSGSLRPAAPARNPSADGDHAGVFVTEDVIGRQGTIVADEGSSASSW